MNLHNPILMGALSGFIAAVTVDYHAFLSWTSFGFFKSYSWSTAIFRWIQGIVVGAITAAGIGLI